MYPIITSTYNIDGEFYFDICLKDTVYSFYIMNKKFCIYDNFKVNVEETYKTGDEYTKEELEKSIDSLFIMDDGYNTLSLQNNNIHGIILRLYPSDEKNLTCVSVKISKDDANKIYKEISIILQTSEIESVDSVSYKPKFTWIIYDCRKSLYKIK